MLEYERQYAGMKKSIEACVDKMRVLDDEYNGKIDGFFEIMRAYRSHFGTEATA